MRWADSGGAGYGTKGDSERQEEEEVFNSLASMQTTKLHSLSSTWPTIPLAAVGLQAHRASSGRAPHLGGQGGGRAGRGGGPGPRHARGPDGAHRGPVARPCSCSHSLPRGCPGLGASPVCNGCPRQQLALSDRSGLVSGRVASVGVRQSRQGFKRAEGKEGCRGPRRQARTGVSRLRDCCQRVPGWGVGEARARR